jgi:hypothetical protein
MSNAVSKAAISVKKYHVLEHLKTGQRIYGPFNPKKDSRRNLYDGKITFKVLGYVDTDEQAKKILHKTRRMKIKNTSKYDDDLVESIIKLVKPSGISTVDVMIKNTNTRLFQGYSYSKGSEFHKSGSPFIVVRMSKGKAKYPYTLKPRRGKGYLEFTVYSDTELLILVTAHEFRHQWQKTHKRGRVWGSKGKFSERDADAYAIRKVREYRKNGLTKTTTKEDV